MGLRVQVPVDATLIASLTWIGKIRLQAKEIAPSDGAAADTAESLETILVLVKSMANTAGAAQFDSDARSLINSIAVDRRRNEAVLTATIPTALLQRMLSKPQDLKSLPVPNSGKTP
jgi:hypothetical protein